jgi:hypothetical protein
VTVRTDDEARWRWVLRETGRVSTLPLEKLRAVRQDDIVNGAGSLRHLAWITTEGADSTELNGKPEKAMRWACWAQGALCALGYLSLDECKRLNMRATWEAFK